MEKLKAFTLVELMVVMAIIAFLSVGAYGGLTFALRQGRDTQRMRIADQIQTALTAYYADYARYPGCGGFNGTSFGSASSTFSITSGGIPITYSTCNSALDTTLTHSSFASLTSAEGGLKEYYEGEYTTGSMAKKDTYKSDMLYYYVRNPSDGSGTKFTVCVALENPNAGMKKTNGLAKPGCYCVGADQSSIACKLIDVP